MSSNSTFPEDYVEADYSEKPIKIKEIHRSNEKIILETEDTAEVKYHSEYLAKGAGLPRAYAVLYNYCKKKSFIEAWCIENAAVVEGPVDVNELVELYMLGYIKQKR